MKKLYSLLVLFSIISASYSQLRIAAIGGPQSASVIEKNKVPGWDSTTKPGFSGKPGINLGIMLEIPLNSADHWFFNTGLIYQSKGRKFFHLNDSVTSNLTDTLSSSGSLNTNYIEVPLNFAYKYPINKKIKLQISAGPYLGFFYSGKQKFETHINSTNKFTQEENSIDVGSAPGKVKTLDFGLNARLGAEIGNVLISGFFSQGLSNFYTSTYDATLRHRVIGASVGFWLNKSKKRESDTDKDGVVDGMDACPAIPGSQTTNGCPDKDNDGLADDRDQCPNIAGPVKYHGCPAPDIDKDGIPDEEDKCPTQPGNVKYKGCPIPDTDGDGLNDKDDKCPAEAGTKKNNGCPEVTPLSRLNVAAIAGPLFASVIEKNKIAGWDRTTKPAYSGKAGLNLGIMLEMPLNSADHWFFNTGVIYQSKGRKFFQSNDTVTANLTDTLSSSSSLITNYVEIPLNFAYKYPINEKINLLISAGPYLGFFYYGKQKFESHINSTNKFIKEENNIDIGHSPGKVKALDFGLNARVGVEIGSVFINGFFSQGLSNFYTSTYDATFRHRVIGASVGFWLNRAKKEVKKTGDLDKDGIKDGLDACPTIPGSLAANGCPDKDNDGTADDRDQCPNIAGPVEYHGCPAPDTDKDGVSDDEDKCPTLPGRVKYKGCPVPDTDGDGLNDESDSCPEVAGIVEFNGCPIPDSDGDGMNDKEDKCPGEAGTKENNGCPEIKLEIIEQVNLAARNIFFNRDSDTLSELSYKALIEVSVILRKNPNWKLQVDGHSDARGKEVYNRQLSQSRAESVLRYLVEHGVERNRLKATGYGSTKPIASNKTMKGQAQNRRVVLQLEQY